MGLAEEACVSVEMSDMVTIPRAELDALKAELRRAAPRNPGEEWPSGACGPTPALVMRRRRSRARSWLRHGESVSDRLVRFPGASWDEIEALPSRCGGGSSG